VTNEVQSVTKPNETICQTSNIA